MHHPRLIACTRRRPAPPVPVRRGRTTQSERLCRKCHARMTWRRTTTRTSRRAAAACASRRPTGRPPLRRAMALLQIVRKGVER